MNNKNRSTKNYKNIKKNTLSKINQKINKKSKLLNNNKTKYKYQRGGNVDKLKQFFKSRLINENRIILNKYDLVIIIWFIYATLTLTNEEYKLLQIYLKLNINQLTTNEYKESLFTYLLSIINDNNNIISLVSSKENEDYNAKNLTEWITKKKNELATESIQSALINFFKTIYDDTGNNIATDQTDIESIKKIFSNTHNKDNNNEQLPSTTSIQPTSTNLPVQREAAATAAAVAPNYVQIPDRTQSQLNTVYNITHFWYKKWPDHGVPTNVEHIKEFIKLIKNDIIIYGGTTVIHCSAGVGRTGVVYIILKLLFDIEKKKITLEDINAIKICEEIKHARQYRHKLVQTVDQANLILKYFKHEPIEKIKEEDFFQIQPTGLKTNASFTVANKCNIKNRYSNITPYDDNRVKLVAQSVDECVTYINASPMEPGIFYDNNVITTQCPIDKGTNDFKQMLKEQNVKRIIMVTNLMEQYYLKCDDYTGFLTKINNNNNVIIQMTKYNLLDESYV